MFKKSVKEFFKNPIITVPNIIALSLMAIFSGVFLKTDYLNKLSAEGTITNYEDMPTEMAKLISYLLLIIIFYFFINPLVLATISLMTKNVTSGEKPKLLNSLKEAIKYYWRLLGVSIFKILIFMALSFVFIIAMVPFLMNMKSYADTLPISVNIILFLYFIVIIVLAIIMMPIEIILVYDKLTIGGAISKGFKFGYRKLFKLLFVSLTLAVLIIISNYIFINLPPSLSIISTLFFAYISTFINVYITNLYKFSIKEPSKTPILATDTNEANIVDNSKIEISEADREKEQEKEKENKFII
jgi:hypothetical protein